MTKPLNWNWAAIAATISAIAGVVGTVLVPLLGSNLTSAVEAVLQALAGVLVAIPAYHVSVVAKTRALARG